MTASFFYSGASVLDQLKQMEAPTSADLDKVIQIITKDDKLAAWFYEDNEFGPAPKAAWVPLLRSAGQFEELGGTPEKATLLWRLKAKYLAKSASDQPDEVLRIITEIHPFDIFVQSHFLDALTNLPVELAVHASWIVWDFLGGRQYRVWTWVGKPVATFMVKTMESDLNLAFGIARYLLEIWSDEGEGGSRPRDIVWRFESAYEYNELMFKYVRKVWEACPFRAATLLIRTLDTYLEEINRKKKYDVSTHFYVTVENLDKIERDDRDYETILIAGICKACRAVIEREAARIPELFSMLRGADKEIFKRIEMYLLRFVPDGTETARIEEIVGDASLFDSYGFKYEYALLLRDKGAAISEASRNAFRDMVRHTGVDEIGGFAEWFRQMRGREYTQEDLEKYENRMRAARLYLAREAFPDLYDEYRRKAGAEDEDLEPPPRVRSARCVSPTEGSPMTVDDAAKMKPSEVFAYVSDPSRWQVNKEKADRFFEPRDALGSVFKQVVKQRISDYVMREQAERVVQLDGTFTEKYFYGVWDAIRGNQWNRELWRPLVDIAKGVVDAHKNDPTYKDAFRAMLSALHDAFGEDDKSPAFDASLVETFWSILSPLVRYDEAPVKDERERDPMQLRCSSVKGNALGQVVCLGILGKRDYPRLFEERLKGSLRELLQYVVADVRRAEVLCTFGIDFARLVWLDEEWVCAHVDAVFADDMWGAVWGTYVSWSQPSRRAFDLLYEKGKYRQAVGAIGEDNYWKFSKKTEEGLSDHLMVALFNGWLESDPNGLLAAFLAKAPASLRGHAASFLTSGFEALREKPDEKVGERLQRYWEQRLTCMEKDPQAHKEEAVQFLYWAKDSPLGDRETLRLLQRTLALTGGEMGQRHFPTEFFQGICEMSAGNELCALRCLTMVMADQRIESHISLAQEALDGVFGHVRELAPDYPNVAEIWKEAMQLADALGRLRVYRFRSAYEELHKKMAAL
jgi:hypothetical protein